MTEEVHLVDDDHDLLAPVADGGEEESLRFRERTVGRGDEDDQVRPWNELGGEPLVLADDRVGPRGINDVDVAEQFDRRRHHLETVWSRAAGYGVGVLQPVDLRGCRRDPLRHESLSQQRVDEGAFSRVELANDHHEEQRVELPHGRGQRGLVVGGRPEPRQRVTQGGEQLASVRELIFGRRIEYARHA